MTNWNAIYSDGTSLKRYNQDGSENSYSNIDRNILSSFQILNGDRVVCTVFLERPTQKLIYRRRVFCDQAGNQKGMVILVGWHENIGGKSYKAITYLYEDGHIELDGARNDLELVPCES